MPKVALYALLFNRQSERSVDRGPVPHLSEHAGRERWQVVDTYHDGAISGASVTFRPGVRSLLQDASVAGSTLCSPGAAGLQMPILVRVSLETPRTPCGSNRPRRDSRQHNRITLGGCLNRLLQQNRHETDQQRCPQLGRYRGKADMAQVALFGRRMNSKRKMASAHACYWQGNNVRA